MVANLSKPMTSIPALSRFVKPIGPSILFTFFSLAKFIAKLMSVLETSSSSIKSNQPNRTLLFSSSLASL